MDRKTKSPLSDSCSSTDQTFGLVPKRNSPQIKQFLSYYHPDNRNDWIKTIPLCLLRSSIAATFLGYWVILQPYDHALSNYFSNPPDGIKLAASLAIIGLLLALFFYLLNDKKEKPELEYYNIKNKNTFRTRLETISSILSIITTILMQAFLIQRLFITFLVKQLVPITLGISCLLLMVDNLFDKSNNCCKKNINSLLFFTGVVASVLLSINALQMVPAFISYSLWQDRLLPITLLISIASFSILTIQPLIKCQNENSQINSVAEKKDQSNGNETSRILSYYSPLLEDDDNKLKESTFIKSTST